MRPVSHPSAGPTRRTALALLTGTAGAALFPGAAAAQAGIDRIAMIDRLAELTGFAPLPGRMVDALFEIMPEPVTSGAETRILTALYTGVLPDEDGPGTRIAFADALMWHAIEDYKNVISYCGGMPGFWAEPPQSA